MSRKIKNKRVKKHKVSYYLLVVGIICLLLSLIRSIYYLRETNKNTIDTSEKNTQTVSQLIKTTNKRSCRDLDLSPYTVKNSYNNFTVCFPKSWNIKNSGAKNYDNNIVITSPDDKKLVYSVKSLIYNQNPSDSHSFQFTNIPFEQAVNNELMGSNPQFKVDHYTTTNKTPEIKGVEYSYKVYENLENTSVVWFIKSTKRANTYYSIRYEYDETFNQESVQDGKNMLLSLIENFSDAP